jgi:hypothetical protein
LISECWKVEEKFRTRILKRKYDTEDKTYLKDRERKGHRLKNLKMELILKKTSKYRKRNWIQSVTEGKVTY